MQELYHHGIRGQKWGKQNGPPYPLSAGSHSAAEKKAGWRDSLNSSGSKAQGSKKSVSKQGRVNKAVSALKKKIQDIPPEKKEKAKRVAKTALKVAGGVAIAGLVGYGAAKYIVNPMMYNKLRNDFIQKAVKAHKLDIVRQASENDFLRLTGRGRASESMLDYLQERAIKNFNRWNDADLVKRKAGNVLKAYAPGHGSDWVKFRRHIDHIRYLMGK